MNEQDLNRINLVIRKLVNIANGEDVKLTAQDAYIAVRVMDLTEGFIRCVTTNAVFAGSEYRSNE